MIRSERERSISFSYLLLLISQNKNKTYFSILFLPLLLIQIDGKLPSFKILLKVKLSNVVELTTVDQPYPSWSTGASQNNALQLWHPRALQLWHPRAAQAVAFL